MEPQTGLLVDVTVALALALAGGWIATRVGVSSILGYVAAGVVISPFTPGFVGELDRLRLLADIGVVLLLFGIGVQFSLSDLARAGPRLIASTIAQTLAVFGIVAALAAAAGADRGQALYVGAAAAISSSVVLVRMLDERNATETETGRITVSWSIVQDLTAIILILIIGTATAGTGDRSLGLEVLFAALKATTFVGGVLLIGSRAVPFVLERVIDDRSRELFVLAIAALALGTALASEYAGLSLALGAFVAGLVISESTMSQRVIHDLLPTRDVFAVLFFVAAGMLIRPDVLLDEWLAILARDRRDHRPEACVGLGGTPRGGEECIDECDGGGPLDPGGGVLVSDRGRRAERRRDQRADIRRHSCVVRDLNRGVTIDRGCLRTQVGCGRRGVAAVYVREAEPAAAGTATGTATRS